MVSNKKGMDSDQQGRLNSSCDVSISLHLRFRARGLLLEKRRADKDRHWLFPIKKPDQLDHINHPHGCTLQGSFHLR